METICQTAECTNKVPKPNHKLCLDCWKKQNGKGQSKASSEATSGGATDGHINASKIGEHFGVKVRRVNAILSELGWITPEQKGWNPTAQGLALNATQKSYSGTSFVIWPPDILNNKILCAAMSESLGQGISESPAAQETPTQETATQETAAKAIDDFRRKFPATFRATDGHWVRSKAEMLIDNFLYTSGIVHAYERKLPIEEVVYTDFYLLKGKVYIEYWGLENDVRYAQRKQKKLEIYKKHNFNLIELSDEEVKNLDDHLPRLLLKFGIEVD